MKESMMGPFTYRGMLKYIRHHGQLIGVYAIEHASEGWLYVGSASNVCRRLGEHIYDLRVGRHPSKKFQEAYYRNHSVLFYFKSLLDREAAYQAEQALLDELRDSDKLLNSSMNAKSPWCPVDGRPHHMVGQTRSEQTKLKISQARIGKYAGINNPRHGVTLSEETKQKISDANKGRIFSEETKALWSKQREGKSNPKAKSVRIEGVIYDTIKEAAEKLGLLPATVGARIRSKSPAFANWEFAN